MTDLLTIIMIVAVSMFLFLTGILYLVYTTPDEKLGTNALQIKRAMMGQNIQKDDNKEDKK